MNGLRKIGGLGALLFAAGLIISFAVFAIILPAQGVTDPSQVLKLAASNPILMTVVNLINVILGVAVILLVPALTDRLRAVASPAITIAAAFGLIAAALYFTSGAVRLFGIPAVASASTQNQAATNTAYMALGGVGDALGNMAFLIFGVWVLLISWAALQPAGLPRPVSYLGILFAGLDFAVTFFQPLVVVAVLVGIVLFIWLGLVLWQKPAAASAPALSGA